MSKQIVILSGSPRKNGNTEQLVCAFQTGAESVGHTVKIFPVAHMNIRACTGCEHCIDNPNICAIKDDMQGVLTAIVNADIIVWASPVYYFSVTAQLKAAIDRCYPLPLDAPPKQAALLLTCADASSDTAEGALAMYRKTLEYYGWHDAGIVIATGVEHKGDIAGHEALELAENLGQKF